MQRGHDEDSKAKKSLDKTYDGSDDIYTLLNVDALSNSQDQDAAPQ